MTGVTVVGSSLILALVGSEISLRGTKLQTGLSRVLVVWGLVYLGTMYWLIAAAEISTIAFTIFWGGAFLTWFGVRSHLESSILLRMLVLLRGRGMTERQLVNEYISTNGEAVRLEELFRGGLAQRDSGGRAMLTNKGKTILRCVAKLR